MLPLCECKSGSKFVSLLERHHLFCDTSLVRDGAEWSNREFLPILE